MGKTTKAVVKQKKIDSTNDKRNNAKRSSDPRKITKTDKKKKISKTNNKNKNKSRSQNKKKEKYIKPVKSEIKSIGYSDNELSKNANEFIKNTCIKSKEKNKDNENIQPIENGNSIAEIISLSSDESCKKN